MSIEQMRIIELTTVTMKATGKLSKWWEENEKYHFGHKMQNRNLKKGKLGILRYFVELQKILQAKCFFVQRLRNSKKHVYFTLSFL